MNKDQNSKFQFFKVCPRGFANEVTYYRVPIEKIDEVESEYEGYNDGDGYCCWTDDKVARLRGVFIEWADRDDW
jgi:hypothetical protein